MSAADKALLLVIVELLGLSCPAKFSPRAVIDEVNLEFRLSLNVVINFNNNSLSKSYQNVLTTTSKSLIVYNDVNAQIPPIYQLHTRNLLVIVWLYQATTTINTIEFLEHLLWKLHWMEILFIAEQDTDALKLFEKCWSNGFTNVLLYNRRQLFTYHPYPQLQVKQLTSVKIYKTKQHLRDLQGQKVFVPFRTRPPHCFQYRNRKGDVVLAGYWYKLIDIFIKYYNGTTESYMVSVEESKTPQAVLKLVRTKPFDFVPTSMYLDDNYSSSIVFALSKVVVICAVPVEINKSLYMLKAFHTNIWLLYILTFVVLWLMIILIYKFKKDVWDLMGSYMDACNIMTHQMPRPTDGRSILIYILHLMPFLTGFLLTNFYNCNLSSMLTARIFERPLLCLKDLATSDKLILESMNDIKYSLSLASVPDYIKKRLVSIESKYEFYRLRRNLMVDKYFYTGAKDLAEFYLFQQLYLTRPVAKTLEQPLYERPYFFAMPHRSPLLQYFNHYLRHVQENGLYEKLQYEAKWDGIIAKEIHFFAQQNPNNALVLSYFYGAFSILVIGLMLSLIVFVYEIYFPKRNDK